MSQFTNAARAALGGSKRATIGYWRGFRYPFRGMKFVFIEHGHLFRYWMIPILLTLVAFIGLCWSSWVFSEDVTNWMWEQSEDSWWLDALHGVLEFLVAVLMFGIGIFLVMALTTVFAAPFNAALSEEVERIVTHGEAQPFSLAHEVKDIVRTVALEIVKLLLYASIMLPLLVLSWVIPIVGPILYAVFGFLFTTMYFAIDYIDWPAGRRNLGIRYRFGLARKHFMPMFGFGTGVWLFLFIPFLNLVFMPAAVAGGTLLYLELEAEATTSPTLPA